MLKRVAADEETLAELVESAYKALAPIAGGAPVDILVGGAPVDTGHGHGHEHGHGHDHGHAHDHGPNPFKRGALPGVKRVVPVTSGKGGVGKSTVAVNLAAALTRLGNKVGILDLDIFGPSIHKMLGASGERLSMAGGKIIPAERHGMKLISVGMATEDDEALIMRGPMVMKVLDQLINQVGWGELDYLVVDLPPGTGDVPLSLVQNLAINSAVVVTTPQDVALIDVRRAVAMFNQTQTHILGIVENMSYYQCEKCGDVAHIFGHDGGAREALRQGLPLLAQLPLTKTICEEMDRGQPIFDEKVSPSIAKAFENLARRVIEEVDRAPDPCGPEALAHQGGGGG
ncbi:MAG: Mrp/NBP35 family ATP-binding protein [Nitrospinae bacterium]|nr:Mrp/NBP35 family ATP-binding protein [Nitrospinota bacterium]